MPIKDPEARRKYAREWMAARRATYFTGKCCVKCGATDRLELDHIDPSTKVSHCVWSWSAARREVELAKCQVLCSECHLDKTVEQGRNVYHHGTKGMYDRRNCRCPLCKRAIKLHWREYRSKLV